MVVLPLVVAQQLPAVPLSQALAASKAPMQTTAGVSSPAGKVISSPLVAASAALRSSIAKNDMAMANHGWFVLAEAVFSLPSI